MVKAKSTDLPDAGDLKIGKSKKLRHKYNYSAADQDHEIPKGERKTDSSCYESLPSLIKRISRGNLAGISANSGVYDITTPEEMTDDVMERPDAITTDFDKLDAAQIIMQGERAKAELKLIKAELRKRKELRNKPAPASISAGGGSEPDPKGSANADGQKEKPVNKDQ